MDRQAVRSTHAQRDDKFLILLRRNVVFWPVTTRRWRVGGLSSPSVKSEWQHDRNITDNMPQPLGIQKLVLALL